MFQNPHSNLPISSCLSYLLRSTYAYLNPLTGSAHFRPVTLALAFDYMESLQLLSRAVLAACN